jgi:hypothetical protein
VMPMSRKSMLARTVYQPSQWRIVTIQIIALRTTVRYFAVPAQLCSWGRDGRRATDSALQNRLHVG